MLKNPPNTAPCGELIIRTLAMPKDTNANGDIFGGWLISQMDIAGAILAGQTCQSRVATVAISQMTFLLPVYVGDTVSCYGKVLKVGHTSMHLQLQAWTNNNHTADIKQVTEGLFVFVALDENRKPQPVYRK